MLTRKTYYLSKRILVQFKKCDSNGENPKGSKYCYLRRSDLTDEEAAQIDGLLESIIDRQNTAPKPKTRKAATVADLSADTASSAETNPGTATAAAVSEPPKTA